MTDVPLFDLPATPTPEQPTLSATRKLTLRRRAQIAAGVHPVTGRPLLDRGRGLTCGGCANLFAHGRNRTYWKCRLNATHGAATDVRVREPACDRYEAQPEAEEGP